MTKQEKVTATEAEVVNEQSALEEAKEAVTSVDARDGFFTVVGGALGAGLTLGIEYFL